MPSVSSRASVPAAGGGGASAGVAVLGPDGPVRDLPALRSHRQDAGRRPDVGVEAVMRPEFKMILTDVLKRLKEALKS